MFCPQCGSPGLEGKKFCTSCGARLPEAVQQAPSRSAPTPTAASPVDRIAPKPTIYIPPPAPAAQPKPRPAAAAARKLQFAAPRKTAGYIVVALMLAAFVFEGIHVANHFDDIHGFTLNVGDDAPTFALKELKGEMVRLEQLKGRPVMIYFWAEWCGPCKSHMPEIQKLYNDKAFPAQVVSIATASQKNNVQTIARNGRYTFPILYDQNNKVGAKYALEAYPTLVILDRDGKILYKESGVGDLRQTVESTLSEHLSSGSADESNAARESSLAAAKYRIEKSREEKNAGEKIAEKQKNKRSDGAEESDVSETPVKIESIENEDTGSTPGRYAHAFALENLAGAEQDLKSFRGEGVMLYFWTDWCPACKAHLPALEAMHKDKSLPARIVTVATKSSSAKVESIIKDGGYTFPVLLDKWDAIAEKYGIDAYPTTILVGRDGRIVMRYSGASYDDRALIVDAMARETELIDAAGHFEEGTRLAKEKRFKEALAAFREAAKDNENDVEAWHQMGHAALEAGDSQTALEAFKKTVALQPVHECGIKQLIGAYEKAGKPELALEKCRIARLFLSEDKELYEKQVKLRKLLYPETAPDPASVSAQALNLSAKQLCSQGKLIANMESVESALPWYQLAFDKSPSDCWRELLDACIACRNYEAASLYLEEISFYGASESERTRYYRQIPRAAADRENSDASVKGI